MTFSSRCCWYIAACIAAAVFAANIVQADKALQNRLTGLLPMGKEIAGWSEVAGSLVYGEGKGLTEIYDGGYRQYLDNGVVAAARRAYKKTGLNAEIVLHRMSSPAAGAKLAGIKRADFVPKTVQALRTLPKGWSGFAAQDKGYAVSYVYSGNYLAVVTLDGQQAKAAAATALASKVIAKALAAEKAAPKSRRSS